MEENQKCTICGEEKVLEDFPIDRRAKSGYKKVCKSCFNEKYKGRNNKPVDVEKVVKEYLKEVNGDLFKALSIQAITEERAFLEVMVENLHPKAEFMNIVAKYKSEDPV